jgi:hypothetical protein
MEQPFPTIPGYRVVALAGQGGMGAVYKAEQAMPRRTVAIKVLTDVNISAEELAAFHREAEVIAHLEHPRIVPLYSFGQQQGTPYLVLRYLGGGSVADRLRAGPLDLTTAARWLSGVADALDFAHQKKILHRDIKPSNILLDGAGNAYLTDFGIAGTITTATASAPVGSAAYMSPEQARGEAVDGRADLYALAVTLFEMLTGRKPYLAETALGLVVRHINDPIPSARALNPAVPPAVDELIQWTMAKDPAARPQSAAEFARSLQQALAAPNAPLRAVGPAATVLAPAPAVSARRGTSPLVWIGGLAVIGICLLVGLLGGGSLLATVFFAPTPTARPTATELSTATVPVANVTATPPGQLLFDDFSVPAKGFARGDCKTDGVFYGDHLLCIVAVQDQWFWSKHVGEQKVAISVDALLPPGPAGSEIGVICRYQDQNNYTAFLVNGQGQYSVEQDYQGTLKPLKEWTTSPALKPGMTHHLQANCTDTLSFGSDGTTLLSDVADPHPVSGEVALMAAMRTSGSTTATFSKLLVMRP